MDKEILTQIDKEIFTQIDKEKFPSVPSVQYIRQGNFLILNVWQRFFLVKNEGNKTIVLMKTRFF